MAFTTLPDNYERAICEIKADRYEITRLRIELEEAKAAQARYAAEREEILIELNKEQDSGTELRQQLASKQAEIDRLMLEYCPDEMTPEQLEAWGQHQRPVQEEKEKK